MTKEIQGGILYKAIENDLKKNLHHTSSCFLQILQQMTTGLSGAEVYLVSLNCSEFSGKYFLKIELEDDVPPDFQGIPFPYAKNVKSFKFGEYVVLLSEPAGLSAIEFKSYRNARPSAQILQEIIESHLRQCQKKETIMRSRQICPNEIMGRMLGKKLGIQRKLYQYLRDNMDGLPEHAISISIFDTVLPNPFAFAVSAEPWHEWTINDAACPCHGDMHGENLFWDSFGRYFLIDLALYTPDGWPFYDNAYFEISELLQNCGTDKAECWLENMQCLANEKFDGLEFTGLSMARSIKQAENSWINEICTSTFSYSDTFKQARQLARVISGLNFAAKRDMEDEKRLKAFLYAAAHLKALLQICNISGWEKSPAQWSPNRNTRACNEANRLVAKTDDFESSRAFILFCDPSKYEVALGSCLARIPWDHIFSFSPYSNEIHLFQALREKTIVKTFYPGHDADKLSSPSWIFAAGQAGQPDSVATSYSNWNKKCYNFFENMLRRSHMEISVREPVIIIDADSLEHNYVEEIIKLCHRVEFSSLGIIGETWKPHSDFPSQWEPMEIEHYAMSINHLGEWCRTHLTPRTQSLVIVPHVSDPSGVVLPQQDIAAIESHGKLIHDKLLHAAQQDDLYSFYYGHPISWEALDKGLYVARENKVESLKHRLKKSDGAQVPVLKFPHFPGAGASMICKAACWKLRNKYPVLELNTIGEHLEDALLRLSSHCGLPLLLLADNNFSFAEIDSLSARLRRRHISALILHPCRVYGKDAHHKDASTGEEIPSLGYLERHEAEVFFNAYCQRVRQCSYSSEEMRKRESNLDRLAHRKDLAELRLPFFFGMFAYEKDFVSLDDFIKNVLTRLEKNEGVQKLVKYLALITQYLSAGGLNVHAGARLADLGSLRPRTPSNILKKLHEICGSPIICSVTNDRVTVLRLVHPLLAEKLLAHFCGVDAYSKAEFYKNFLRDLDSLQSGIAAKEFEELTQDLFLEREWEGRKLKFSPLIEDLGDYNAQKDVFESLIAIFGNNAHFHQHFGRLISTKDVRNTVFAMEHFNRALEIEPDNMVHWHARGNFYLIRVANEIKDAVNITDLYNKCSEFVSLALDDFTMALEKASNSNGADMDAEYPANSIIGLAVLVLDNIKKRMPPEEFKSHLMNPITPEMKWAIDLLEKAEKFALDAEAWPEVLTEYGASVRCQLAKICFTAAELEGMIGNSRTDLVLKMAWMNTINVDVATNAQLKNLVKWGVDLIRHGDFRPGLIWIWFKAVILLGDDTVANIRTTLRHAETDKTLLLCTYLQGCLDFSLFMQGSIQNGREYKAKMEAVKKMRHDKKYTYKPMLYYNPENKIGLSLTPDNAPEVPCKVADEVEMNQSGWLYLEKDPHFRVFFTPVHFGCPIGQSLGKSISCHIAISYDGLRAVKPRSANNERAGASISRTEIQV